MPILLDHLIVPSRDKNAGARFLAELLDVPWEETDDYFTPVYVNGTLTFDFANGSDFQSLHFCFHVSEADFDAIYSRILERGVAYQSSPFGGVDMKINTANGGKNLYWSDSDGHFWEILTVSYARPMTPV
jgi:hypothetical protein